MHAQVKSRATLRAVCTTHCIVQEPAVLLIEHMRRHYACEFILQALPVDLDADFCRKADMLINAASWLVFLMICCDGQERSSGMARLASLSSQQSPCGSGLEPVKVCPLQKPLCLESCSVRGSASCVCVEVVSACVSARMRARTFTRACISRPAHVHTSMCIRACPCMPAHVHHPFQQAAHLHAF